MIVRIQDPHLPEMKVNAFLESHPLVVLVSAVRVARLLLVLVVSTNVNVHSPPSLYLHADSNLSSDNEDKNNVVGPDEGAALGSHIDSELVGLVGEDPDKVNQYQFDLLSEVKTRWEFYLANWVKEETLKVYLDSHPCPTNLPTLNPPPLNLEIAAVLSADRLKGDKIHMSFQQNILHSLSAIDELLNCLLKDEPDLEKKSITIL